MGEKKIWGIDQNTLLVLGWIAPLVLNFAGVILAIILVHYFKNEEKDEFLAEGFRQISNVNLTIYIIALGLVVGMSVFFFLPGIGMIASLVLFVVIFILAIYSLFVCIMGAIEASKHNIYVAKYQIELLKR